MVKVKISNNSSNHKKVIIMKLSNSVNRVNRVNRVNSKFENTTNSILLVKVNSIKHFNFNTMVFRNFFRTEQNRTKF